MNQARLDQQSVSKTVESVCVCVCVCVGGGGGRRNGKKDRMREREREGVREGDLVGMSVLSFQIRGILGKVFCTSELSAIVRGSKVKLVNKTETLFHAGPYLKVLFP